MQRKASLQKIGVVLLFLGTAALGIMVGLYLFMTNPELLPLPEPDPTSTPVPAAVPTQAPEWKVTFEHRFTSGDWAPGSYQYFLTVSCPNTGTGSWTGTYTVSDSSPLRNSRVFLRTQGPMDASTEGSIVGAVNPSQSLGAAITLSYPTLEQAEAARANCAVRVQSGGGQRHSMEARIPSQDGG